MHENGFLTLKRNIHSCSFFKKLVFSFDQQCKKSDSYAFPVLLKLLDTKHSDLIFIDDNIVNIRNAIQNRIDTIHLNAIL
jgi:FMN phosphatase YigB (HAD superfamily)